VPNTIASVTVEDRKAKMAAPTLLLFMLRLFVPFPDILASEIFAASVKCTAVRLWVAFDMLGERALPPEIFVTDWTLI
jgi:hypothetical protein